jgi:HEAT repeat protein
MRSRILGALALAGALVGTAARVEAQTNIPQGGGPPVPISQIIPDLKAAAPYTRNGAAYQLAHMGPAAAPAVPALIDALGDPDAAVRYAVTVALREIGPAAKAAVPALKKVMDDDINDEVSSSARRALRAIDPTVVAQDD